MFDFSLTIMKTQTRWESVKQWAFSLSAVFAELAIGVPGVVIAFANDLPNRWWVLGLTTLFLAISLLFTFARRLHSKRNLAVYLLVEAGLTVALVVLNPRMNFYVIWFYVLTIEAIMGFSRRTGLLWLAGFVILTVVTLTLVSPLNDVLITIPIYLGGFFFFATFANATFQANEARKVSLRLLEELQEAHEQLHDYAGKAEQLAVSEERNRLSREMHDTIGHRLTVAAVQLEGVERLIARDPEKAAEMTAVVRDQIREALGELRRTVATLREPLEADLPFETSIRRLVDEYEAATDLKVHLMLPEQMPELSTGRRLVLYRTAQEALTNVQKHAGAGQVWVQISQVSAQVTLRVSDDGIGLKGISEESGFGLRGIRERAGRFDGELRVELRRGGGTDLSLSLPIVDS
jgi:signal transduction histidine kinase